MDAIRTLNARHQEKQMKTGNESLPAAAQQNLQKAEVKYRNHRITNRTQDDRRFRTVIIS